MDSFYKITFCFRYFFDVGNFKEAKEWLMCLLCTEITSDTYATIITMQYMRFSCAVNISSWYPCTAPYVGILLPLLPRARSLPRSSVQNVELLRGWSHPFFLNVSRTLSWTRLWGRARTDAEISAVPRRDLPHNDAQSPSSMNAPIFSFNKLMPQCHSIFRLLVRHKEIGHTRTNRRRLNAMRYFPFFFFVTIW